MKPTRRHAKPRAAQLLARIYRRQIAIDNRLNKLTAILDLNTQVLQNKLIREWLVEPNSGADTPLPAMTQCNRTARQ